jgi:hypothetical protein
MDRHTNTANLTIAATDLLIAVGRLREHEMWGGPDLHRSFIMATINEEVGTILRWMAENGLTVVASEDKEAA